MLCAWQVENSQNGKLYIERRHSGKIGRCWDVGKKVKKREGKWNKPQKNTCKLNCDVAVIGEGRVWLGFVIRDDKANVVLEGKKEEEASGSSTLLEGHTMRYALQMSKQYGIQIAKVESDGKTLIKEVNGQQLPPQYCDVIKGDIWTIAK